MTVLSRACLSCQTPLPDDAVFCHMCGTATPTSIDRATGEMTMVPAPLPGERRTMAERLQKGLGTIYEVKQLVGRGGFAEVYAARDIRLKRDLAVKVLRPELVLSDVLLERFRREAEAVAALRHPGIVPIYDVGEGEGLAYIIMPLIQGETLKARLDRVGKASIDETEMILLEAASALSVAHEEGMVHRDIKPENIMLEGKSSRVLLMDFGIAKAVDIGSGDLTQSGVIVGTPQYMSPEQASGDRGLDHRADQYALAVVGYRMLTGKLPFDGETTRVVLYRQLVETPEPAHLVDPEIPVELSEVLQRAMAKDRDERFPTIDEFAAAVIRFRASHTPLPLGTPTGIRLAAMAGVSSSTKNSSTLSAGRSPNRHWGLKAAAALALISVVGVLGMNLGSGGSAAAPSEVDSLPAFVAGATTDTGGGVAMGPQGPGGGQVAGSRATGSTSPTRGGGRSLAAAPVRPPNRPTCAKLFADLEWEDAFLTCSEGATGGSREAQRILGTMYALGHGTAVDYPQAAVWWERAATRGDNEARYRLAELFDNGRGVEKNRDSATALYRLAGSDGHLQAQLQLGQRYERGDGVKGDHAEGAAWYRRAAEQGNLRALGVMASFYQRGRGVEKDLAEAARWFRLAADAGDAEAQYQLGRAYDRGEGVGKSEAEAIKWWEKARAQAHREARNELRKRGR